MFNTDIYINSGWLDDDICMTETCSKIPATKIF